MRALPLLLALAAACAPEQSPLMRPGESCVRCHSAGNEGAWLPFSAAGTVFRSPASAPADGLGEVDVELTDAAGKVVRVRSNPAGNFYTAEPLALPLKVALEHQGRRRVMERAVDTGDCASCHAAEPKNDAPGRLYFPVVAEDTLALCRPCGRNEDCGGNGNYCLRNPSGHGTGCGVGCDPETPKSCPEHYDCLPVGSGGKTLAFNCVPAGGADCAGAAP